MQRIELVGDRGRIEIVGETLAFQRFEPPLSEHLPTATGMFDAAGDREREPSSSRPGGATTSTVHRDFAAAIRTGGDAARAGARRALVARARERDRSLDAHRPRRAAAGRPRRLRGAARGPALREGQDALTRIAFSNLAAPDVDARANARRGRASTATTGSSCACSTASRSIRSPSTTRRGARRAMLSRSAVPLVSLDTSIELARPFERELPPHSSWRRSGARRRCACSAARRAGCSTTLRGGSSPCSPSRGAGVTIALETHDSFASAARVGELLRRVDSPSFAAVWDVHHPYRARRVARRRRRARSARASTSCT